MDEIAGLLDLATKRFDRLRIAYFVTGSAAAIVYGKFRATADVDIVASISHGMVPSLCAAFPPPEFNVIESAVHEAIDPHSMFNIIHDETGFKVDVVVPRLTRYVELQFERSQPIATEGGRAPMFISPEDLIIAKMQCFREEASDKHLTDCASVVKTQPHLARHYVEHWAQHFGLTDIWQTILKRVEQAT